jgi:hypothetical protein
VLPTIVLYSLLPNSNQFPTDIISWYRVVAKLAMAIFSTAAITYFYVVTSEERIQFINFVRNRLNKNME